VGATTGRASGSYLLIQLRVVYRENTRHTFDTLLADVDARSADEATIRLAIETAEAAPIGPARY
jgi:hypothetical protein